MLSRSDIMKMRMNTIHTSEVHSFCVNLCSSAFYHHIRYLIIYIKYVADRLFLSV
ncbi:hypothetical protein JCM6292_2395 [Bacteroides pyogenes JCM 6292]|uniref:Uncharacterized protein n=2 Tax=Bacteroides pyogenes TaxID=310300 RepID=W4PI70_9BACE|nr:hypothetical protein JCM6292_2395 [Bacteroides pyogenes JCM 6292]GAE19452.1 hypothetical protein JCM6294_2501 [Bacteroides pyogenes DSM 20611 = JCM 6294]